jgi:Leucine-rich repeat (LRR) protein
LIKRIKKLLDSRDINSARQGLELLLALRKDKNIGDIEDSGNEAFDELTWMLSRILNFGIGDNKWGPNRISGPDCLPFKCHSSNETEIRLRLFFAMASQGPKRESLKILDLSQDSPFLPDEISILTALEELDLSLNPLSDFPSQILKLSRLKRLGLSGLNWRKVPKELLEMTSLESIDLSLNPLEAFPTELASLPRLKALDLSGTALEVLPDLSSFESLEVLALAGELFSLQDIRLPPQLCTFKLSTNQWQLADALCEMHTGKEKLVIEWVLPDNCPNCTKFFDLRITARSNENTCPICRVHFSIIAGEQHDWFIDGDSLRDPDSIRRTKLIASDYSQKEFSRRIAAYPRLLNSPDKAIRMHAAKSLEDTWPNDEGQKVRSLLALAHKDIGLEALRESRIEDIRPFWPDLEAVLEDPAASGQYEAEYAFVTYGEPDLGMARLISVSAELFEMIRGQAEHASHALKGILCSIFKKGLDIPDDCLVPATRALLSCHSNAEILIYAKRGVKENRAMLEVLRQILNEAEVNADKYAIRDAVELIEKIEGENQGQPGEWVMPQSDEA